MALNIKKMMELRKEGKQLQKQMQSIIIVGESKDESIKITINGIPEITDLEIDDDLLNPDRKKELIRGIKEAFKDAHKKLQKEAMKDIDMDRVKEMFG